VRTVTQLRMAGSAVALYTGWNARSLVEAWQHSPFDREDAIAWIIWIVPVFLSLREGREIRFGWVGTALALAFAGVVLDLNLLRHLAFGLACAGLTAPRRGFWLWLPMALTWMPVLGWFLSKGDLGLMTVGLLRVSLATIGTVGYLAWKR